MILSASLTCLIVLIFALLGVAKILALGPMPELAAHAGFTIRAYRTIGGLELAGAIGVALSPVVPLCGGLAGAGLLMLLAGAVTTHLRKRDGLPKLVPALMCVALVAWYLVLLADVGSSSGVGRAVGDEAGDGTVGVGQPVAAMGPAGQLFPAFVVGEGVFDGDAVG